MLLLSLQASDKEKRELWPFMRQSVQNQDQVSTSPLPPLFDRRAYTGEGGGVGFEPDLAGVGNLNRKCQVFPTEYKCYIFQYGSV